MAYFVGLDVSVKETSVCIVDDAGKIVREARKTGKGWIEMPPGSATPRVHHAARRLGGSVAASGARGAGRDAGDRVSQRRLDDHRFSKWKAGSTRNVINSRQWVTPRTASLCRRQHKLTVVWLVRSVKRLVKALRNRFPSFPCP